MCQLSCIVALLGVLVSSCQRTGSLKTIAFSKVLNFRNCFLNEGAYDERWLKPLYFTPSFKWFCNLITNVSLLTTWSNFWALQWSTLSSFFSSVAFFSVALSIYLLLSILKFARLVQIQWLEVKHPIFNWFEFQLLNFQLNKTGFETSLNRKPVGEFPLKEPFE